MCINYKQTLKSHRLILNDLSTSFHGHYVGFLINNIKKYFTAYISEKVMIDGKLQDKQLKADLTNTVHQTNLKNITGI